MSDDENSIIPIRNEKIHVRTEDMDIYELRYFSKNPRIGSIIARSGSREGKERQEFIETVMKNHENVINLVARIKREGGLQNPVFVRFDTREVIEGNSRLAAYRKIYEETDDQKWSKIPCRIVASLTLQQVLSYLNEEHGQGKGKKSWSPYENAHSFFNSHFEEGLSITELHECSAESINQISKYIDIIKMMKENDDNNEKNFSYYNVIRIGRVIYPEFIENSEFKNYLYDNIKNGEFKEAKAMRDNLPNIIPKKKVLNKLINGEIDFDEASDICRPPNAKRIINIALEKLKKLSKKEIEKMNANDVAVAKIAFKRLKSQVDRIGDLLNPDKKKKH